MSARPSPVDAADRVAETMTALKAATRTLDDPTDAVWIIGSLQAASISLMLTLRNLSTALQTHAPAIESHPGPASASRAHAMVAAARLEEAAREHTRTFAALIKASDSIEKVDWVPDASAEPADCRPVAALTAMRPNAEIRSDAIGPTL